MGSKIAVTVVLLLFSLPFSGVGVFATWGIGKMFSASSRANDWVLVQAKVDEAELRASRGSKGGTTYQATGTFSYKFADKPFRSTQLSFDVGGSDNIGDWQHEMGGFLDEAKRTGKTIPVYVNPDNPNEAVVDRDVRWSMVFFLGIFGLLFGGAGFTMLGFAIYALFSKDKGTAKARKGRKSEVLQHVAQRNRAAAAQAGAKAGPVESNARSGLVGLWIFTLIWNLIAFPIAMLAVPDLVRRGEYVGLLVLIFPFVGVLMLWGCIAQSIALLRRGKAVLAINDPEPRMGGRLSGTIAYPRSARQPGEEFELRLSALMRGAGDNDSAIARWWSDVQVRTVADPRGGVRLPFQFDVPARVKGQGPPEALQWQISAKPKQGGLTAQDDFEVSVLPPLGGFEDAAPAPPTPAELRNDAAIARLFGAQAAANMTPAQREAFAQLSPEMQKAVGKIAANTGTIKKVVIGIVILVVAVQVIGALVAILS